MFSPSSSSSSSSSPPSTPPPPPSPPSPPPPSSSSSSTSSSSSSSSSLSALQRSSNHFACFPGSARLQTPSGSVALAAVTPGTQVLALDPSSNRLVFSRLELFLHRSPSSAALFIRLHTARNESITLTPSHLLFRLLPSSWEAVFARDVRPGDLLLLAKGPGRPPHPVAVTSCRQVTLRGFYAPLTELGTVVVDNHVASCFAHVRSHRLASWAVAPFRFLRRWVGGGQGGSGQGVHWYAQLLLDLGSRILPKGLLFPG